MANDNLSVDKLDLASLLQPIDTERFFRDYWENQHLTISDRPSDYYQSIFSTDDFESVLRYGRPKPPDLVVVAEQEELLPSKYVKQNGDLNLNQLYKAYDEGHTLIINELQRFSPKLAELCRHLYEAFNYPAVTNAYLTPPDSTGLHPHFDTHDVFVLQIAGKKNWKLFGSPTETPLLGTFQPVIPESALPAPNERIQLAAGDLLYVPRGVIHCAEAMEESSLHVTVGIYPTQWADLLSMSLTMLSSRDIRFRKALPPGFLHKPQLRKEIERVFDELKEVFYENASTDGCLDQIVDQLMKQIPHPSDDHFPHIDAARNIELETILASRSGMRSRIIDSGSVIRIQFPGNTIKAPLTYREALYYISKQDRSFTVGSIPGSISDEQKIKLSKRLVRGGLLKIAM